MKIEDFIRNSKMIIYLFRENLKEIFAEILIKKMPLIINFFGRL